MRVICLLALACLIWTGCKKAEGPFTAVDANGSVLRRPLPSHRDPQFVRTLDSRRPWKVAMVQAVTAKDEVQVAYLVVVGAVTEQKTERIYSQTLDLIEDPSVLTAEERVEYDRFKRGGR